MAPSLEEQLDQIHLRQKLDYSCCAFSSGDFPFAEHNYSVEVVLDQLCIVSWCWQRILAHHLRRTLYPLQYLVVELFLLSCRSDQMLRVTMDPMEAPENLSGEGFPYLLTNSSHRPWHFSAATGSFQLVVEMVDMVRLLEE